MGGIFGVGSAGGALLSGERESMKKSLLVGKQIDVSMKTRISLEWLRQRFMERSTAKKIPDRILMGWKAYSQYVWITLSAEDKELIDRTTFYSAEVIRDASIGEWDVVFGFTSKLEER